MEQFLKNGVLFALFTAIGYIALTIVWGSVMPYNYLRPNLNYRMGSYGHMFSRVQEAEKARQVDVLVMGSSHAYRGFDPRIFETAGIDLFNFGSSSQTPLQSKVLLERYIDSIGAGTVILEVYPALFGSDGVESTLDLIANTPIDCSTFELVRKVNHIKTWNTFIYGIVMECIGKREAFEEKAQKKEDLYISNGYVEKELSYFDGEMKDSYSLSEFNPEQFQYFEETLHLLKERGTEVILIFAPITQKLYNTFDRIDDFEARMEDYPVPYYNFNERLELKDSLHFYDGHHLNQRGVEIFNQAVIELLRK